MKKKNLLFIPVFFGLLLAGCGNTGTTGDDSNDGSNTPAANEQPAETVKRARKKTVELSAYSYTFDVSAKIKFKSAVSFSPANYSGETYVDANATGTQFLQRRELSGALVIDSTNYIYNVGTDLIKISANENKDFSVINHETVDSAYDFDTQNFGHVLKKLSDNDFLKVERNNLRYDLSLQTNFSQDSLLGVLNFIDSKTIIKTLSSYTKSQWGVGFTTNTWVTLTDDSQYLKTFHFDAAVNIKDTVEIGFELNQTFTRYASLDIALPTFSNTIIEENDVKSELNTLKGYVNTAKALSTSYYTFDVKTTVDHGVSKSNPLGLAVNSRTQGKAKRQIVGNDIFFNNRLEVDSDYKNKDQLGDLVKDYDSYRARLNNGDKDVYDVLDPKVGFNKYTKLESYNEDDIDNYYMLPGNDLLSFDNVKVVKKTTDNQNNTVYRLGLSTDGVRKILSDYNKSIRIDFDRVTIFDIYKIDSDFNAKKAEFLYTVDSTGRLLSVSMDIKGFYVEKDSGDQVKYRFENEIEFDYGKSYTAATTKEDIDN